MNRFVLRIVLGVCLILASAFAAWGWLRPYDWHPDPAARGKIEGVQVVRDHSHFWLTVRITILPGQQHDLQKPVRLLLGDGRTLQPGDTTLGGENATGITDIWFKFWLNENEISTPLSLQMNDGTLIIKKTQALPVLRADGEKYFTTSSW